MSNTKGIFDNFPTPGEPGQTSPFAPAESSTPSPFMAVDDSGGKTAKIPERRASPDSPFQFAGDSDTGFGFEPVSQATQPSPFDVAPADSYSPFAPARPAPSDSPFAPAPVQESPAQAAQAPTYQPEPPPQSPFVAAPPPAAAAPVDAPGASPSSDSSSIRQLELRAIFGVDREMTADEILQRCRNLPGIRHVARIVDADAVALEAFKAMLGRIGFGTGNIRLYSGSVPIEFIREGRTVLAIQTDGGFAPGVRETLMIVARELSKM